RAGEKAKRSSAHEVAIAHFRQAVEVLERQPESEERLRQELQVRIGLGAALIVARGYAAPEVGEAYARARELCGEGGEMPQLFSVLRGLFSFRVVRAEHPAARGL